jgi:hypothetical protein
MAGDQPLAAASDPVLAIFRMALPQVYGYLLPRCGSTALAEDLTSETFLATLGGLSPSIYLLQGGRRPIINPDVASASPIATELLIVPMAVGVAWLELGRFLALRSTPPRPAQG